MTTTSLPKHDLEIISSSSDLAKTAVLQVIGTANLKAEATLLLRFTFGSQRSGRVVAIKSSGTRAVIEVEGERWCLHRRGNIVNSGPEPCFFWVVDDCDEDDDP